jgi:hypothetical protein
MPVNDFAIPRGATEPVTSKQTAEKVWEPKFLAEIVAGRDPHLSPSKPKREGVLTVADFFDQYFTNYVEAEGLKTPDTIRGHIKQLTLRLGELPVTALEKPADIARFKAQYRKGRELATVNRVLGVLRAAVNWGRFQDPPLLSTSPFHRFGISIKRRDENKRDRRIHRDEEQQLLCRVHHDEHGRAQVGRTRHARPDHRRAGNLLPAGRDAAHQEQGRRLGAAPDCHPRRQRQRFGEPADSVRSKRPAGSDIKAASVVGAERLRVRFSRGRVRGQL